MKALITPVKDIEDPAAMITYASGLVFADLFLRAHAGIGIQELDRLGVDQIGIALVGFGFLRFLVSYFLPICHRILVGALLGGAGRMFGDGLRPTDLFRNFVHHAYMGFGAEFSAASQRAFGISVLALTNYYLFPEDGLVAEIVAGVEVLPVPVHFVLYLSVVAVVWLGLLPAIE